MIKLKSHVKKSNFYSCNTICRKTGMSDGKIGECLRQLAGVSVILKIQLISDQFMGYVCVGSSAQS